MAISRHRLSSPVIAAAACDKRLAVSFMLLLSGVLAPLVALAQDFPIRPVVTGGDSSHAEPGLFDSVVLLLIPGGKRLTTCTGALIAPDVVLTAAHCLESTVSHPEKIVVWAGDLDLVAAAREAVKEHGKLSDELLLDSLAKSRADTRGPRLISKGAVKVLLHPRYVPPGFFGALLEWPIDIGIVVLPPGSSRGLAPFAVAREPSPEGRPVVLIGYGSDTGAASKEKIVGHAAISAIYDGHWKIAGGANSEMGDSGGPLLADNATTARPEIIGVCFGHVETLGKIASSIYTRIDTQPQWLDSVLRDHASQGQRHAAPPLATPGIDLNKVREKVDRVTSLSL